MAGIANRKFAHHSNVLDAFFFQVSGNFFNFRGMDRLNFPASVIDGACNRKIMGIGAVKFRIDAGAAGDDHTHERDLMLNDGVGGQGGA